MTNNYREETHMSILIHCTARRFDDNGKIIGYNFMDSNGRQAYYTSEETKELLRTGTMSVLNLKLTSDNRITKTAENEIEDIWQKDIDKMKEKAFRDREVIGDAVADNIMRSALRGIVRFKYADKNSEIMNSNSDFCEEPAKAIIKNADGSAIFIAHAASEFRNTIMFKFVLADSDIETNIYIRYRGVFTDDRSGFDVKYGVTGIEVTSKFKSKVIDYSINSKALSALHTFPSGCIEEIAQKASQLCNGLSPNQWGDKLTTYGSIADANTELEMGKALIKYASMSLESELSEMCHANNINQSEITKILNVDNSSKIAENKSDMDAEKEMLEAEKERLAAVNAKKKKIKDIAAYGAGTTVVLATLVVGFGAAILSHGIYTAQQTATYLSGGGVLDYIKIAFGESLPPALVALGSFGTGKIALRAMQKRGKQKAAPGDTSERNPKLNLLRERLYDESSTSTEYMKANRVLGKTNKNNIG